MIKLTRSNPVENLTKSNLDFLYFGLSQQLPSIRYKDCGSQGNCMYFCIQYVLKRHFRIRRTVQELRDYLAAFMIQKQAKNREASLVRTDGYWGSFDHLTFLLQTPLFAKKLKLGFVCITCYPKPDNEWNIFTQILARSDTKYLMFLLSCGQNTHWVLLFQNEQCVFPVSSYPYDLFRYIR